MAVFESDNPEKEAYLFVSPTVIGILGFPVTVTDSEKLTEKSKSPPGP